MTLRLRVLLLYTITNVHLHPIITTHALSYGLAGILCVVGTCNFAIAISIIKM